MINERYEKASIALTSNRDRAEWPELFGEPLLASAALDRLTHAAHFVEIIGPSFRAEHNLRSRPPTADRRTRANLHAKRPVTSPHWLHMGDPGWLSLGDR